MEAAHIPWRPLGRLLIDEGLLTPEQLEEALENQVTTGHPLGEIAVELGFVSRMALSGVLSAQYGVEVKSETGFGTGLRAELERREGSELLPPPEFVAALPPLEVFPPADDARLADLEDELEALRQTSEYGHEEAARLSQALSARDQELEALREAHERRHAQAAKFAMRMRARASRVAELEDELSSLRSSSEQRGEEAATLAEAVSAREAQLAEGQRELEALRKTFERRRAQTAKFATRMRARDARVAELENDLAARRDEVGARDGRIAELEGELAGLRHAAEQAHDEASKLRETLSARDAQLAALRQAATHGQDEAAQLVETLRVRDGELAARERELAELHNAYEHRSEQAARFAQRARERSERVAQLESRKTAEAQPDDDSPTNEPAGYIVFAQLAQRYALVECDGAVPAEDATLDLPEIDAGLLRVVGVGRSPLPNDPRSCVFAECVYESA